MITRRWLLFVQQLASSPSNLRVRTWRRLQQLGAVPLKQAAWVLPDTPDAREDFEWLAAEVKGDGGDAVVFSAESIDNWTDDAVVEAFRAARQEAYRALEQDVARMLTRVRARKRPSGARAPAVSRFVQGVRERLAALERADFGGAGRERVNGLLSDLEARMRPTGAPGRAGVDRAVREQYRGRTWVTRPRPGVDRMASAWLIRRFIDAKALFGFARSADVAPAGAVPFDMVGVEFTHRGEQCTFETLCVVFGIAEPAVHRLGAIVHDLDLKDGRFGAPEAGAVGSIIDGLQLSVPDDDALLDRGILLFESLYQSFARVDRDAAAPPARTRRTRRPAGRRPRKMK